MLVASLSGAHAEPVRINISYTEVHNRILPTPAQTATTAQVNVQLSDSGVQHDEMRQSGKSRRGVASTLKLGTSAEAGWHVAGPNKLINIRDFDSYNRAILMTVTGNSCSADIGYHLKPGFLDYRYRRLKTGEPAVATSVKALNVVCSIR